ncbi:MAG: hypothetical protein NTZ38_01930 [Candidatus Taylorbacteria bacterium]|nr:hypothetical protein [Candidatus Taylorbacteria bacterium]
MGKWHCEEVRNLELGDRSNACCADSPFEKGGGRSVAEAGGFYDTICNNLKHNFMTIFAFGNPDLPMDSLPLRILPQLRERFLSIEFMVKDPNEEWDMPEDVIVLDTVVGIKEVKLFEDIERFKAAPSLSMHDFDALANLRFLKKLGKVKSVKVIGVPVGVGEEEAVDKVGKLLGFVART